MTLVRVDVTDEYLSRLFSNPFSGLVELIENSLDADASRVEVAFIRSELGAIESIVISDDGDGITSDRAMRAFGMLGGSWKANARTSRSGRPLRGRRGHGRWAAFALGEGVTWVSLPRVDDASPEQDTPAGARTKIRGERSNPGVFEITDEVARGDANGTRVTVTGVVQGAQNLDSDSAYNKLNLHLAYYLERHPNASVTIDGKALDPSAVQRRKLSFKSPRIELPDYALDAELVVVEWDPKAREVAKPKLILCDSDGTGLYDVVDGVPWSPIPYTAYLRWSGFAEHRRILPLATLGAEPVADVATAGIGALKEYFDARRDEARSALISQWKEESSYPYTEAPAGDLEAAERDLFDVVAVTAAPALQGTDVRSRKLSLRLIREALQRDPTQMGRILEEVIGLSDEQMADLAHLLSRTTLPAIIGTAKLVAHRLETLDGLEHILFNSEVSPHVLERRHLHEIVAAEPWIFAEEYALSSSDRGLTEVLRAHRRLLGEEPPTLMDEEPVLLDGRVARVDLMLSRSIENARNRYDHLVVELKRPSVTIGSDEVTQLEKYAFRVAEDSRFLGQDVSWEFLLVGTKLDTYARKRAEREIGQKDQDGIKLRFASWNQIIGECRHRLKFVQRELAIASRGEEVVDELRRVHAAALPGILAATQPADADAP
ncbi:ATP-binding protein [Micromonospora echinaurantiaca]|uniref:ATP-binding protein n=1 Tax=Micromonospora echinaurantiaca TaxID=47857 RepID=UPI00342096D1